MTFTPHGRHLVAGEWVDSPDHFVSTPVGGSVHRVGRATDEIVGRACEAAEAAFWAYASTTREDRARLLEAIAEEIELRGADVTDIATRETGLTVGRIEGERGRTTGQLRLFAAHIRDGAYLDRRHDIALPERKPAPRPDIRLMQRPIGPVAVFGASNFPLAFSTAGGDTAAALAAGCPVVVKGHSAHPGTGEIIAEAIRVAAERRGMPAGVFSFVQGDGHGVGAALVTHPHIKAVGFTGSLAGGRALFDLCAARPEPIPFFGELGSVNPMFMLPAAMQRRPEELARGWAASLTLGVGQFCTNPGIAVAVDGSDTMRFIETMRAELAGVAPQTMLTNGIAAAYRNGCRRLADTTGVTSLFGEPREGREASPHLFETTGSAFLADPIAMEEVFGPVGVVIRVASLEEMRRVALAFDGQLTATLHMDDADMGVAHNLLPILERKAGRVSVNGFPTGVEVVDSMVHGGPWPASTNFGATSVGTLAIRRFMRPVAYQNFPTGLLPSDFG